MNATFRSLLGITAILCALPQAHALSLHAYADPAPESAGEAMIHIDFEYGPGESFANVHLIRMETLDGTAVAGQDYQAFNGNIILSGGANLGFQTTQVDLINDADIEPNETIQVLFYWQQNTGPNAFQDLGPELLTLTVVDDDTQQQALQREEGPFVFTDETVELAAAGDHLAVARLSELSGSPARWGVVYHYHRNGSQVRTYDPPADWPTATNLRYGSVLDLRSDRLLIGAARYVSEAPRLFVHDVESGDLLKEIPAAWEPNLSLFGQKRHRQWRLADGGRKLVAGNASGFSDAPKVFDLETDTLLKTFSPALAVGVGDERIAVLEDDVTLKLYDASSPTIPLITTLTLPEAVTPLDLDVAGNYVMLSARTTAFTAPPNRTTPVQWVRVWLFDLNPGVTAPNRTLIDRSHPLIRGQDPYGSDVAVAVDGADVQAWRRDSWGHWIGYRRTLAGTHGGALPNTFAANLQRLVPDGPRFLNSAILTGPATLRSGQWSFVDPVLTVTPKANVWESDRGAIPLTFHCALDEPRMHPVSAQFNVTPGTAQEGMQDVDFDSPDLVNMSHGDLMAGGGVNFVPGETASDPAVAFIIDDHPLDNFMDPLTSLSNGGPMGAAAVEDDETFTVSLTHPEGVTLADPGPFTVTIHDNDAFPWWQIQQGYDPNTHGPTSDENLNGQADVLDWFFAGDDPIEWRDRLPALVPSGNTHALCITLAPIPTPGATVIVEISDDLQSWQEIARRTGNGAWQGQTPFPMGNRLCFNLPANQSSIFSRVRVEVGNPDAAE